MADISKRGPAQPDPEYPSFPANDEDGPRRRTPWNTVGGRVISLISRKGGVGKTTSAVNLGAALALSGHSVLVVGTDPQCGVSRSLGCAPEELPVSLTDIFDCGDQLTDLVQVSPLEGLHFLSPRVLTLEDEERYLESMERRAGEFVREIDRARNFYDTILIDCPPSLGSATRAALLASDSYLVPVQAEELCRETLPSLLEFVDEFRARNFVDAAAGDSGAALHLKAEPLTLEGLFLTMASTRTRVGRRVAARVGEDYGDVLCATGVPRTTRLAEMAIKGRPTVIYDRRSAGSRAYFDLADELVERYCQTHEEEPATAYQSDDEAGSDDHESAVAVAGSGSLNGFDRFLYELAGGDSGSLPAAVGEPEFVPLDELLAEEEKHTVRSIDEWEEGYWAPDADGIDRIN